MHRAQSLPTSSVTHLKMPRLSLTFGVEACGWTTLVPDTVSHHNLGQRYSLCAAFESLKLEALKAVIRGWAVGHIGV